MTRDDDDVVYTIRDLHEASMMSWSGVFVLGVAFIICVSKVFMNIPKAISKKISEFSWVQKILDTKL